MATLLLIVIYVAFIGLGIPDSIFGTAWPAIYQELNVPVGMASCVTMLVSAGTIICSLVSARVINRYGTRNVVAFSTMLTALALLGFSFANHLAWMCLLALPLGLGAGAIDTALNNYVAVHYKAAHMNFLHCFYGVGVSLSPYLMSLALADQADWRGGYRMVFCFQLAIALITIITLPLWTKAHGREAAGEEEARTVGVASLAKMPTLRAVWLIFFASCGIEYTCGTWGSTFLVNARGMAADLAARMVMFYYIGMALGRFLSGVLAGKMTPWQLIHSGQGVMLLGIALLFMPVSPVLAGVGLFLIGLGNGPLFPNLIHLTPRNFGEEISQSVMGTQMAVAYTGILSVPMLFGVLAQNVGVGTMPGFLIVMFAMMTAAVVLAVRMLKKEGRY